LWFKFEIFPWVCNFHIEKMNPIGGESEIFGGGDPRGFLQAGLDSK
jgi:hypothetical protein